MAKKNQQQGAGIEGFESALTKTEEFIEDHQKILSIIVGSIVLLVIIYMGYNRFYKQPLEEEAQTQMFMAERYFAADSMRLALNGDGSNLGFLAIIDEYGNTKAGELAHYYAGIAYLHRENFQQAIDYLKQFDAEDKVVAPLSLGAIGDAYMELGEDEMALAYYKKAARYNNNQFTCPRFLKKAAGVHEKLQEYKEALELYSQIEEEYPEWSNMHDINKYLMRAKIRAKKQS